MGNIILLLFIMLIAAANLCAGFGLAVYLGRGPGKKKAEAPAEGAAPHDAAGHH